MRFIELFAGIGGFRYGLERVHDLFCSQVSQYEKKNSAGLLERRVEPNTTTGLGNFTCVWANEIDKYACQIYRKNYGDKELYEGDIHEVEARSIPDHDLLVGGFPCQAFSIAGKRGGFNDTRGTLFFEIARIVREKQPRLLLLENVKGLLSHDKGRTFTTILSTLDGLGYDAEWQVLNSKNFGVPQNRERVFIIGHLRGSSRGQVFPIGENDGLSNKQNETVQRRTQAEVSHTLKGSNIKADNSFIIHNVYGGFGESKERRFYDNSPTIRTANGGGHIPMVAEVHCETCTCDTGGKIINDSPEDQDAHCETCLCQCKIRRLTPAECERLQGFPDGWTEGVSDTQRYKCLGNAVTTNVITAIGLRLKEKK